MKIGKTEISNKTAGVVGAIVGLIALVCISSYVSDKKAKEAALEAARLAALNKVTVVPTEALSLHEQTQRRLSEKFGVAPDGFEWDYDGSLIPIGDATLTCEDVVYTFLRSLSMLDFATAEKYSSNSTVIDTYRDYFESYTSDYYDNFLRKQFKESITSIEINDITDVVVFADGTQYVTLSFSCLDLTDKEFWLNDRDELFDTMYAYSTTEDDDTKMESYLYDYIYSCYTKDLIAKKDYTIDLVVSKDSGAWLVSNDRELRDKLSYQSGVDIARHILDEYNAWVIKKYTN